MNKFLSAKSRIAVGLVALLVSVLMLAVAIGLVPDTRSSVMDGRAKLCEVLAIGTSLLATRGDLAALQAELHAVAGRNKDVLSAAVRQQDGKIVAVVGDHDQVWQDTSDSHAAESKVFVPIFANDTKWGTVEVRFRPFGRSGILGILTRPSVLLVGFVSVVTLVLYVFYLRKVLQHLDPSKVVPGRVRSALDTLAEGLLVIDAEGRVVLANQSFAAIAGRSAEALLGSGVEQLPWVDDAATGASAAAGDLPERPWTRAMRAGQPQRDQTLRLRDASGAVRTFVVNCSPVQGHNGKHRGVLASFEDITVLEAQKVELHKSKQVAEAANQAKSEFLARMSHEIRTPMNAILGFADVLRRGFEQSEAERQEYLETIHASGQHLMELINDILDLSKIEAGRVQLELTQASPHQVISEVITVLRVRAKQKGIALDYRWDGGLPVAVRTDPTRLRQVLTNLIGNAIKFTDRGGVTVVTRMVADGGTQKLAIDVTDSGIGIKPESVGQLFQPFAQADTSITRRFGGTGLGLVISRQLAEAMGGGITVTSEFGKGSTFTCTIDPGSLEGVTMLQSPPAPAAASRPAGATAGPQLRLRPIRVLSVDDGTSNQKLITLVLGRAGAATIDTAANGKDGLEMAMRGGYDIVLMDMQMPVMDGYTAVRELRRTGSTVPVVALTAHAMRSEEVKCRAAGCTSFLSKPIDVDKLVAVVADLTGGAAEGTFSDARVTPGTSETATGIVPSPRPAALPAEPAPATAFAAEPIPATGSIRSTLPTEDADFREIVHEFVERLDDQLAEMQSAWEQRELDRVATLAHWLKGSGGTAGFNVFTNPARQLEQFAKEERLDDVAAVIAELQQLAAQIDSGRTPSAATPAQHPPSAPVPTEGKGITV